MTRKTISKHSVEAAGRRDRGAAGARRMRKTGRYTVSKQSVEAAGATTGGRNRWGGDNEYILTRQCKREWEGNTHHSAHGVSSPPQMRSSWSRHATATFSSGLQRHVATAVERIFISFSFLPPMRMLVWITSEGSPGSADMSPLSAAVKAAAAAAAVVARGRRVIRAGGGGSGVGVVPQGAEGEGGGGFARESGQVGGRFATAAVRRRGAGPVGGGGGDAQEGCFKYPGGVGAGRGAGGVPEGPEREDAGGAEVAGIAEGVLVQIPTPSTGGVAPGGARARTKGRRGWPPERRAHRSYFGEAAVCAPMYSPIRRRRY